MNISYPHTTWIPLEARGTLPN